MPAEYMADESSFYVTVKNPVLHTTWEDGQYTSFLIKLQTSNFAFQFHHSQVRRRYSEFVRLRKMLNNQHPTLVPPSLPCKFIFANKLCPDFIEQRRGGLEKFLETVLCTPLYLSNRSLHLFLQSNLPLDQIESIVCGSPGKEVKSEPHLSLHTRLENEFYPTPSEETQQTRDRTDSAARVAILGAPQSSCNKYGSFEVHSHSHVTLGSRITLCSPRLQALGIDDNETLEEEEEQHETGSLDSDYSSPPENSSPNWDKQTLLHGILSSRNSSQCSSLHGSPSRKKKVSFNSEVTVAHLFS